MPRNQRALFVLIGLAALAGCDDRTPPPTGPSPTARVTDVRIEGSGSVAPDATAPVRVIASFDDGKTSDVTSQTVFRTSNPAVLILLQGGLVKGIARGEAIVSATYQNRSGSLQVFVLEDGTYRVSGHVRESGVGVSGVRITVVSGTGTGLTTTTEPGGSYALYGVAGEVRIEAVLGGFNKEALTIVVGGHATADIDLRSTIASTDLRGTWRLTLAASRQCNPPVPEDAATRSYTATITQVGTALQMQVQAPGLITNTDRITGVVIDQSLTVYLPLDDNYYPFYKEWFYPIVDLVAPDRSVAFAGYVQAVRAGNAVTGTLDGEVAVFKGRFTTAGSLQVSCRSPHHVFRLDR